MHEDGHVAHGQVIDGKYQLVVRVAEGDHGELWRGELRGAGGFVRPVAVKVVPAALIEEQMDVARFLARVRRSAVLEHPNLVPVSDLARDRAGRYHVVMPWVEGLSLRELVRGIERLGLRTPWPVAVEIAVDALRGLASAHAHLDSDGRPDPVLHGELSPDRILVGLNGVARVAGYGILGTSKPYRAAAADVLVYQAPELARHAAWSARADLFGVGAVLWQALTGAAPLGDVGRATAFHGGEAALPSLGRVRPNLPARLVAAIDRTLAYRPEDRFASADEMAAELTPLLAGVPWQKGPQADLGRAVREAAAALGRSPRDADSDDLFEVAPSDIIGVIEVAEGDPSNPILLNHLAAEPLSTDDLQPIDDEEALDAELAAAEEDDDANVIDLLKRGRRVSAIGTTARA